MDNNSAAMSLHLASASRAVSRYSVSRFFPTSVMAVSPMSKSPQLLGHLPYYHRWLNRTDTKDVLEDNGEFVLRKTKIGKTEKLAVSVYWLREIRHFPIQTLPDGRFCFESRGFRVIRDLIRWHQTSRTPLTEDSGAILKTGKPMREWELMSMQLDVEDEEITAGRYGEICEGKLLLRKEAMERTVAVKCLKGNELDAGRESILHEARCLRELGDHPHIVKFYGITVDSFRVMMAIELLSGNLAERLRDKPYLTSECKLKMARGAASALTYIHCHGLIHRHLCAKNCLVMTTAAGETLNLKMTGFDLCVRLNSDDEFVDKALPPMLNVAVCAPESLSKKTWSKASDVWSFGVLQYELFTDGTVPYGAELAKAPKTNHANILLNTLRNGARLLVPPTTPEKVKSLWNACFEWDPKLRPTAFDLMLKLS